MSDLVVLSHLRWTFVWQRPQHIVSRLARERKTWFVEEPLVADIDEPMIRTEENGPVTRVWLEVPGPERHIGFGDPDAELYEKELLAILGHGDDRAVWLYTPMAYNLAQSIPHEILVYDVMDDLASFKGAPPGLRFAQQQALHVADVVFTGGRSLYGSVAPYRPDAHMLGSGVEREHYAVERPERRPGARPVAGYVGVIDERIDLELVGDLAAALSEWEIQ
ncbi:MAG TPA: hypothetical protein VK285_04710, partial [Gaiellaceae bacterium]|nr:hypothetical protein [Gaiellaceae bacterium]